MSVKDASMDVEEKVDANTNKSTETHDDVIAKNNESIESLQKLISSLKDKNSEVIKSRDESKQKVRDLTKTLEQVSTDVERYKTMEQDVAKYKGMVKNIKIESTLNKMLADAGALSISTAIKLVNKDLIEYDVDNDKFDEESVKTIVEKLKETDPFLFTVKKESKSESHPDPKRPVEADTNKTSFEIEMSSATTQKQIEAIMRKHNKI